MSVINKVLRDLDRRNEPDEPPLRPGQSPLRAGVASVATAAAMAENAMPDASAASAKSRRPLVLGVLTVVVLAGAVWDRMTAAKMEVAPVPGALPAGQPVAATAPVVPVAAPLPVPATSVPVAKTPAVRTSAAVIAASAPVRPKEVAARPAVNPPMVATSGVPPAAALPAAKATPAVAAALPAPAPVNSNSNSNATSAAPAPVSATPTAGQAPVGSGAANPGAGTGVNDPAQVVLRQQQAARDALAQAQSLWNNGSRDAAIDLLQQAVATAERSMSASSANRPQLVMLTRELTRMLLADGRAQATWDVLLRLEPQLAGEVDLLAVRANAAQRLGRHQDSVQAYTTALQSRPREQRWLLGAAVSLAALGQTAKATEMAESARQVGPIAREVQAYLRQVGVVLREP